MDKMSPKVIEVKALSDYRLLLKFDNDEQKIFDVEPYLRYEVFKPLKNYNEFKKIHIDFGTVCWECGADLSRDTLYIEGEDERLSNNASDRELLELVLAQVSKLTTDMDGVKSGIKGIKSEMSEMKSEISDVKKTVVKIEHEHGEKLAALFDGYKQNSDKLDRIEAEVSKHEEIILRRVR
jgi:hypothetical protein